MIQNVFTRLKKARDTMKAKRLVYAQKRAENLQQKANYEKELAEHNRAGMRAKEELNEARRINNPFLYKVGEKIKANARENFKANQQARFKQSQSQNVFTSGGNVNKPYWLNQPSQTPYWLKKKKR